MGHDFEPLSARIIEAAIAVHKALGPGFLESIYHGALRVALSRNGIPYEKKKMNFNASTLVVTRIVLG